MGLAIRQDQIFVGRQREMAELREALDDAMAGQGRSVMLAGEPGIGKTRTAQELGTYATDLGVKVLWGWCYEREGAPPYWPWIQPMRSYIQEKDSAELRSQMGTGASDIAQVVPELRQLLPELEPSPILEPEQARFRLFDSITNFLKNIAQSQPLMLVLEDLHWADHSSLMLWEFVSKEISNARLMLLGTYRDLEIGRRHPLSQALGSLIRESSFRRVQLGGLSKEDASRLVELSAGVTLAEPSLDLIHSRTEGNPLFLGELVRLVGEESIGAGDSWISSLPVGVKDIIGQRLGRLSAQCNDTLTLASVIGREFDFRLLSALSDDLAEASLLELIDEALEAHVIEGLREGRERYQFSHALIQETLSEELSTSRRVRLHARIADALEKLYGADAESHAAELAHHFVEAETVLGPDKLARYSLLAGDQALAIHAHEEALTHFERGLLAKQVPLTGTEPVTDSETATLLFGLGRAQAATFERLQYHEALNSLTRAFDYYVEVGDIPRAVVIAEHPIPLVAGEEARLARLLPRALALVPPDSHEAARIMSRYTRGVAGTETASEALGRALTIARREGDISLEIRTLTHTGRLVRSQQRHQEGLEILLQAADLARRNNDLHSEVVAFYWAALAQSNLGDLEGMRLTAAAGLHAAERLHDRPWLALSLWSNQMAAKLEGDWQAAREFGDRGLTVSPQECRILYIRILVEYEVGDFDQAEVYLGKLLEVMRQASPGSNPEYGFVSGLMPMVACITGKSERLEVAEEAAQGVLLSNTEDVGEFAQFARTGLGLMAVLRGDAEAALEQYTALKSWKGLMVMLGGMANDRVLVLLVQTLGQLDQAAPHFEDALTFCRKAGYRPELAWSGHDYADALLHRNEPGAPEKAMSLLEEALAISTELGMRPLMKRVVALQERAESQPVKVPVFPDGLTLREVEVLRLVAAGKSNPEIGRELVISSNTVANHVRSTLTKTNTLNRIAAAGYAMQRGLTS